MNIKNLFGINAVGIPAVSKAGTVNRPIKSENTNEDKDANGQQSFSRQQKKEKMTPEQFAKALELLKEKSFVKDMQWVVLSLEEEGIKYALVQDQAGLLIRKIAEYDLWEVFDSSHDIPNKGQLLRKVA
jgi:hypothetical protein